jgi:integrase
MSKTEDWLNSYGESTKKGYRVAINVFFQFLDQTWPENSPWNGDKIHQDRKASQREDDETRKFKYEDTIVKYANWLHSKKSAYPLRHDASPELTLSDNTVGVYCIAVRSFFAYLRMPLVLNRPQKQAIAKTGNIRNMPYHLTLADFVAMKRQANTKERYVLLVGKSLGLRIGDFVSLRQGLFEGNLKDSDAPYSLGVIITEKRKQPAYPFLDYEAYQAFLDWKQELQALNKWDGKDKYMLSGRPNAHMTVQEINGILKKLASKAGLRLGNLHLSFHCFRRFLCDHLSTAIGDANKWKQIVGKQIAESAYISSDNLREAYAKVMRYTCEERTVKLGDLGDLNQILDEQAKDIAFLKSQNKELKGVIQEFGEGMPKYLPELLRELNAKGFISTELLKQAEKDTVESLARTKMGMDEEFMKVYSKSLAIPLRNTQS